MGPHWGHNWRSQWRAGPSTRVCYRFAQARTGGGRADGVESNGPWGPLLSSGR
jgi:hypothetical protein